MYRQAALKTSLRSSSRRSFAPPRRFQSTAPPPRSVDHTHAFAGLAGGALVLGGLYAYYHISGTAKVVQTTKATIQQAQEAKDKLVGATPSPKEAIGLIKSITKSYAGAAIPGGDRLVDSTFDELEFLADKYGDDVNRIVQKTYSDIKSAISDGKNTTDEIVKALQDASERVSELAGEKGQQLLDKALQGQPELRRAVGDAQQEFQQLVQTHGPKARELALSTYASAAQIVSTGSINNETINKLKNLLSDKTNELRKLAQDTGSDAWEASAKKAGPLLDQIPDLRRKVEEQIDGLKGVVGDDRVKAVRGMYDELANIASSSESTEVKAKKARQVWEKHVGSLEELRKSAANWADNAKGQLDDSVLFKIPGFEEVGKLLSGDELKQLREIASKRGEEAEKILHSTYDEIRAVLRKKADEAKNVADKAQRDVKQ